MLRTAAVQLPQNLKNFTCNSSPVIVVTGCGTDLITRGRVRLRCDQRLRSKLPVRVCAGGARQLASLPRLEVLIEEIYRSDWTRPKRLRTSRGRRGENWKEQWRPLFGV